MIALSTLMKCLNKSNPKLEAHAHRDWHYDIMPAGLHLRSKSGSEQLFSVPKGWVHETTFKDADGAIEHRGWRDIVKKLTQQRLINPDVVMKYIKRAEAGMVV